VYALLLIAGTNPLQAQRITVTTVGTGVAAYGGDGGAGKFAKLSGPNDVCMDAAGNLYISDIGNGRIRKVAANTGIITTYAGGGTSTADGIPAVEALFTPNYMCIDPAGNIYVSTGTQIRRIDAVTGIINTVAGTLSSGYGGDGGPATAASLFVPMDICLDRAGNIYVVDQGNYRIRKISAATNIITTIAGTGVPSYSGDGGPAISAKVELPYAIAVDTFGNVFFSDQEGIYIREIYAATGIINTRRLCGRR
jgi:sugar lactone lactonase YvrE